MELSMRNVPTRYLPKNIIACQEDPGSVLEILILFFFHDYAL